MSSINKDIPIAPEVIEAAREAAWRNARTTEHDLRYTDIRQEWAEVDFEAGWNEARDFYGPERVAELERELADSERLRFDLLTEIDQNLTEIDQNLTEIDQNIEREHVLRKALKSIADRVVGLNPETIDWCNTATWMIHDARAALNGR